MEFAAEHGRLSCTWKAAACMWSAMLMCVKDELYIEWE